MPRPLSIILLLAWCLVTPGQAQDLADRVEAIGREAASQPEVPGVSIAVSRNGSVVVAGGWGLADLENEVPATAETVYRIGSVTKQFTAAAILRLAEAGRLSLDDEITRFLPDYPVQDHKVTIRHLLNHTSGIRSYTSLPDFQEFVRLDLSHQELLERFAGLPFDFPPGESFSYNNSAYYLLGVIVEQASGQGYAEHLEEVIFAPLSMSDTRYGLQRPLIPRRASGYQVVDGEVVNADFLSMNLPGAAGALVSTVGDLLRWQAGLTGGEVVGAESLALMTRPTVLNDGSERPYGYGLGLGELEGHPMVAHGGGIFGFRADLRWLPQDGVAVAVLSNGQSAPVGRIARQVARAALGLEEPVVADLPLPEGLADRLQGVYEREGTEIRVEAGEQGLVILLPSQDRQRLLYQGGAEFAPERVSEARVRFRMEDGRPTGLSLRFGGEEMEFARKP